MMKIYERREMKEASFIAWEAYLWTHWLAVILSNSSENRWKDLSLRKRCFSLLKEAI